MSQEAVLKEVTALRDALNAAREKLEEQDAFIKAMMEAPLTYASVVEVGAPNPKSLTKKNGFAIVAVGGNLLQVLLPKDKNVKIKVGDRVIVGPMSQIIETVPALASGAICVVRQVLDASFSEIEGGEGASRVVFNGGLALEKGDRVLLDQGGTVILRKLEKEKSPYSLSKVPTLNLDEIAGLPAAKQALVEAVELPRTSPEVFKFYNKKPAKGILLYGPPGCGKTMLGRWAASRLAELAGDPHASGFLYIKGPEILDKYVGVAEGAIRGLFARAHRFEAESGFPAVIFIDEAESILGRRGNNTAGGMEKTIVPMFLAEMDGLENSGALVILATNRADQLDPAITRDKRIDRKIKITRPTIEAARDIFALNLRNIPLKNGYSHEELAGFGAEQIFSPERKLYEIVVTGGHKIPFPLSAIINGAMVAGVVDHATSIALQRDLGSRKPQGLAKADIMAAVELVESENRGLDHADALADFIGDDRSQIVSIQRVAA